MCACVCVCVRVYVRARARVRACVCVIHYLSVHCDYLSYNMYASPVLQKV